MFPFHNDVRIIQGHPVGPVHPLEGGHVFIDFKDHGPGLLHDGLPAVTGQAQAAVPVGIGTGHGHYRHVHFQIVPVHFRQQPQQHGDEMEPPGGEHLPFIGSQMPAVVLEMLHFRVAVDGVDDGTVHQPAPDLHIRQLVLPGGQGFVHQFREPVPEAEIHPVSAFYRLGRFRRRHHLIPIFFQHSLPPSSSLFALHSSLFTLHSSLFTHNDTTKRRSPRWQRGSGVIHQRGWFLTIEGWSFTLFIW